MPIQVQEHKTSFANLAELYAGIETLDQVQTVPSCAPDGTETRFQLVQNLRTGDYVAQVGKDYVPIQNDTVFGRVADALDHHTFEVSGGYLVQTDKRVRALIQFDESFQVGNDESPYHMGCVVRNSCDGTTGVEVSFFFHRGYCENGMVFGKSDILGAKDKHVNGAEDRLTLNLDNYFAGFRDAAKSIVERLSKSQAVLMRGEDMETAIKSGRFGKKMTEDMMLKLPGYQAELGDSLYTVYQAVTDTLTHYKNGAGNKLSQAALDRHQKSAEALLLWRPTE